MRKIILLLLCLSFLACGAPQLYHDYRDYEKPTVEEEPMRFSSDPLLDSVYRARYLEMLRRCGSGDDMCRKSK